MKKMNTLFIGKNYSDDPSGRYYTDGDGSGEEFREEVLKPLLESLDELTINIDDNVEGYGSSFLVEAFGGLVKHGYFTKDQLLKKITISLTNEDFEFYKKKIIQYINEAEFNSVEYLSKKNEATQKKLFKNAINKNFIADIISSVK